MNWAFSKTTDIFAIALTILAFYVGGWGVFDNVWVSGLTVWLALIVGFLNFEDKNPSANYFLSILHVVLAIFFTIIMWKWTSIMLEQEAFFIEITFWDNVIAWAGIAIAGYLTLRHFGIPMFCVFLVMVYYVIAQNSIFGAGEDWVCLLYTSPSPRDS